jgi:hypothetical protein
VDANRDLGCGFLEAVYQEAMGIFLREKAFLMKERKPWIVIKLLKCGSSNL